MYFPTKAGEHEGEEKTDFIVDSSFRKGFDVWSRKEHNDKMHKDSVTKEDVQAA